MVPRTVFSLAGSMYHSPMRREILFTGIGGQGVQLAARTLAEAAVADGRRVQLFASYGGMMRGGNSDSFLTIAEDPIKSPPVLGSAWAAVVMHHEHAGDIWPKLREGGLALVNSSVVDPASRPTDASVEVIEIPALDLATELGSPIAAQLVVLGALVAHTGVVSADSLVASAAAALPSYRADAVAVNRRALDAGMAMSGLTHPAWELATA